MFGVGKPDISLDDIEVWDHCCDPEVAIEFSLIEEIEDADSRLIQRWEVKFWPGIIRAIYRVLTYLLLNTTLSTNLVLS